MASTAAPSPPFLSPRPTQRPAAMAAASVTRTSSMARLRSGASRWRVGRSVIAGPSSSGAPGGPEGPGEVGPDPRMPDTPGGWDDAGCEHRLPAAVPRAGTAREAVPVLADDAGHARCG